MWYSENQSTITLHTVIMLFCSFQCCTFRKCNCYELDCGKALQARWRIVFVCAIWVIPIMGHCAFRKTVLDFPQVSILITQRYVPRARARLPLFRMAKACPCGNRLHRFQTCWQTHRQWHAFIWLSKLNVVYVSSMKSSFGSVVKGILWKILLRFNKGLGECLRYLILWVGSTYPKRT